MNNDETAQMFLDECLYNAGLITHSPFEEDESRQTRHSNFRRLLHKERS